MKGKQLDTVIRNWCMFGAKRIVINVFENKVDDEIFYTSALLFWLDDGVPDEEYEEKTVTVFTDIVADNSKRVAMILGEYASSIFDNVDAMVYVFNADGDIIEEFDLNEFEDDDLPEINLGDFGMVETHKKSYTK